MERTDIGLLLIALMVYMSGVIRFYLEMEEKEPGTWSKKDRAINTIIALAWPIMDIMIYFIVLAFRLNEYFARKFNRYPEV